MLLFVILSGRTNAQNPIYNINDLNDFAEAVSGGNNYSGRTVNLMNSIPDTFYMTIGNDHNYFQGRFNGNGHTIIIKRITPIPDTIQNVGLFSRVEGSVWDLVLEGTVVGGAGSVSIGGICGELISGQITNCSNYAEIGFLLGYNYHMGGIAGKSSGTILYCVNNGDVYGRDFVGGIVGYYDYSSGMMQFCSNAGKISGTNHHYDNVHHGRIGGIAGQIEGTLNEPIQRGLTNIGHIDGGEYNYVGGIVGFLNSVQLYNCSNAGMVNGSWKHAGSLVGGIAGHISAGSILKHCINTNKITQFFFGGAIAGVVGGGCLVDSCYYDEQMSCVGDLNATNMSTLSMLGDNMRHLIDTINGA